jgi:hypothetical protein
MFANYSKLGLFFAASLLAGLAVTTKTNAGIVNGSVGQLTQLMTFVDYGTGDVVVKVQTPLATCQDGFWLRMTDIGAKQTYAQLLGAWHTQQPLTIWADDGVIWSGSGGRYCRIYSVVYQ